MADFNDILLGRLGEPGAIESHRIPPRRKSDVTQTDQETAHSINNELDARVLAAQATGLQ